MAKKKRQFWGQIIYEKVGDGCFNGLWNNNDSSNQRNILNEITRKSDGRPTNIAGNYTSCWIERTNDAETSNLIVTKITNTEYSFRWIDPSNAKTIFQGVGMEIGLKHIAVTYWFGHTPLLNLSL